MSESTATLNDLCTTYSSEEKRAIHASLWANVRNVHAPVENLNMPAIEAGQNLFTVLNSKEGISPEEREIVIALSSLVDDYGSDLDPHDHELADWLCATDEKEAHYWADRAEELLRQ